MRLVLAKPRNVAQARDAGTAMNIMKIVHSDNFG